MNIWSPPKLAVHGPRAFEVLQRPPHPTLSPLVLNAEIEDIHKLFLLWAPQTLRLCECINWLTGEEVKY